MEDKYYKIVNGRNGSTVDHKYGSVSFWKESQFPSQIHELQKMFKNVALCCNCTCLDHTAYVVEVRVAGAVVDKNPYYPYNGFQSNSAELKLDLENRRTLEEWLEARPSLALAVVQADPLNIKYIPSRLHTEEINKMFREHAAELHAREIAAYEQSKMKWVPEEHRTDIK